MLTDILDSLNLEYHLYNIGELYTLLILKYGGRLFLLNRITGESIFWVNSAIKTKESFSDFVKKREWNIGGERIWIAPEIQYHAKNRDKFWDTYGIPGEVDPGNYNIEVSQKSMKLYQEMELEAYNTARGANRLRLNREISRTLNPLHSLSNYSEIMEGVEYGGYLHSIELEKDKGDDEIMSEAWDLVQVNPSGYVYIPCTPGVEYINFYEPIEGEYLNRDANTVSLKITGDKRYKVGFKSPTVFGRIGYLKKLNKEKYSLLIKNFFNNPSSLYVEEPIDKPGERGLSVSIYNDSGQFGGFGEIESNSETIGGESGIWKTVKNLYIWYFEGAPEKIIDIAPLLLTNVDITLFP